jgi:threonine/homoserine/homoserine lactone efflux protein
MTTMAQAAAFAGVVALGAMSPGPDFAVVVRRSAVSGRALGMAAAAGVSVGVFGWVMAAATGIAALLAASAVAFTVVKLVGGAYLVYLGAKALWAARRAGAAPEVDVAAGQRRPRVAFGEGLLTNLLNPKAALFFVALVPQFLDRGSHVGDAALLSLGAAVGALTWFLLLANLVGVLRAFFARPAVRRTVDAVTGATLIALGIRLAVASRP